MNERLPSSITSRLNCLTAVDPLLEDHALDRLAVMWHPASGCRSSSR